MNKTYVFKSIQKEMLCNTLINFFPDIVCDRISDFLYVNKPVVPIKTYSDECKKRMIESTIRFPARRLNVRQLIKD